MTDEKPMLSTRPRGRPAYQPTAAKRRECEEMVSVGMAAQAIASVIGIDVDTLKKHFASELAHGAARRHAEITAMLYKAARKGNVSAQKKLHEIATATIADLSFVAPPSEGQHQPRLGKKEAATLAAQGVGGDGSDWGDDLTAPGARPN